MPHWFGPALVLAVVYLLGVGTPFTLIELGRAWVEIGGWLEEHPVVFPTSGLHLARYRAWLWNLRLWWRG